MSALGEDSVRRRSVPLVSSQISDASPAWHRIIDALAHRARHRRATERSG
ncbi:hypothetical protein ACFYZ9_26080 [Streptomyces sp. NPDC001691]